MGTETQKGVVKTSEKSFPSFLIISIIISLFDFGGNLVLSLEVHEVQSSIKPN